MLPPKVRRRLSIQRLLSHIFFPIVGAGVGLTSLIRGYRNPGRRKLRRRFLKAAADHDGPLLVCPNHLTMIDSVLLDQALASNWTYLTKFRLLPWNIPEWENFRSNLGLRLICYLGKCAPIRRSGTTEQKKHLFDKLAWLLEQGDSVCIFPEGTRSKTGRLETENFGYGVGQLAVRVPSAAILCVYMRAETPAKVWPNRNEDIYTDFKFIKPESRHKGRRAARDISIQAMDALREMEDQYFRENPEAERLTGLASETSEMSETSEASEASPVASTRSTAPLNGASARRSLEPAG
jgi:1-acyl-sn-glycerol-3-phosphate acyltransferase